MELGDLIFGNSRGEFLLKNRDLVNCEEWKKLLKLTNCDSYGRCDNETGEFDCELFTIRSYYWGDDEEEMTKPNFVYKPIQFTIDWYKYPFRDSYMNQNLNDEQIKEIWQKCIDFMSDKKTVELTNEEVEYLKIVKEKYQEKNICNLVKKLEAIIEQKEIGNNFKNMFCENYNCGLNQKIQNLRQQLSKMGEEINIKNKKLAELKKELTICKDTLRRKTQSNRDLQHRVHKVNTEFAIKELQHIEDLLFSKAMQITGTSVDSVRLYTINEIISGEIEKLKG